MKIIYDGLLIEDVLEYCLGCARDYGYAIELKNYPKNMDKLNEGSSYTVRGENCMGQLYTEKRDGLGHAWVSKNHYDDTQTEGFFFVKTKDEYEKVICLCSAIVINKNPFKTYL